MDRDQSKDIVLSHSYDYLAEWKAKRTGYICPVPTCGNGTGSDGTGITAYDKEHPRFKCMKCGWIGDIFDYYATKNGCDKTAAFQALYKMYGVEPDTAARAGAEYDQHRRKASTTAGAGATPPEAKKKDMEAEQRIKEAIQADIKNAQAGRQSPEYLRYIASRGISPETAAKMGIGFLSEWRHPKTPTGPTSPRLIIPFDGGESYGARSTSPNAEKSDRYKNAGAVGLYNVEALTAGADGQNVVFLTEGALDTVAFTEIGASAAALNGTGNAGKMLDAIIKRHEAGQPLKRIILALDDDDAGKEAAATIANGLQAKGIKFQLLPGGWYGDGCKDAGEALVKKRASFSQATEKIIYQATKPDDVGLYLTSGAFLQEVQVFRAGSQKKTGFPLFDKLSGGIFSGLYIIGAQTGVGKTTFSLQLADQLARNGENVIFFTLEQSRLELVSKSIARTSYDHYTTDRRHTPKTSLQIRAGQVDGIIRSDVLKYAESVKGKMSIVEPAEAVTPEYLREYVSDYIINTGSQPIVFLDYIQLMQAPASRYTSTKERLDCVVTEVKKISRDFKIPIVAISSINRAAYDQTLTLSSFKESGLLEFTADVVWGLEFAALADPRTEEKNRQATLEKVRNASEREIRLHCLKNRYGKADFKAKFEYIPAFDYFTELENFGFENGQTKQNLGGIPWR